MSSERVLSEAGLLHLQDKPEELQAALQEQIEELRERADKREAEFLTRKHAQRASEKEK